MTSKKGKRNGNGNGKSKGKSKSKGSCNSKGNPPFTMRL